MNTRLAHAIATFCYVGKFPVAPGTLASAVGAAMAIGLKHWPLIYLAVTALVIVAGFLASGVAEKASGKKDPGFIVIDEVAGIMIAFFMVPLSWAVIVSGFFLFRAFDMFKIWPANKFEDMGGAKGIMMDDIMAGIYTNIVLQIAIRLAISI